MIEHINKFREFAFLKDTKKRGFEDVSPQSELVQNPEERALLGLVFAPNAAGFPTTDLSYSLQADVRPEVAAYIRNTFMTPIRSNSVLGSTDEDGDFAIECQGRADESLYDYTARLRSLVNSKKDN